MHSGLADLLIAVRADPGSGAWRSGEGGDAGNGPLSYAGFEGAVVAIYNDGLWQATCAAP